LRAPEADRIVGLYRRQAAAWATARGTRLGVEQAWLGHFRAALPAGGSVLDLGCGPGRPIAAHLSERGHPVTGVDSSPEMLAMARGALPEQEWILADMRGLALGRRFAGVLAWDSFFHLDHDDQRAMFPVFAAHAAPGAALMFTSGPAHGIAMGALGGEPLFHASLAPGEYEAWLAANGFSVLRHVAEDPGCGGRTVWLARQV
jgi:SAM-dependent methyltransferase